MPNEFKILALLLLLASCSGKKSNTQKGNNDYNVHVQMGRAAKEFHRFDTLLINLYTQAEINPKDVLDITDGLIIEINTADDPNNVRENKLAALHELRAEILYKLGECKKSVEEIFLSAKNFFRLTDCHRIALACNFVKMNDFKTAKSYIDSVSPGYYIYDYTLANYFEVTRSKDKALQVYREIVSVKSNKHYFHYNWALKRIAELMKRNPKLLDELYFETQRPDVDITDDSDDSKRTKILNLMSGQPYVKNGMTILIYQDPEETGSNYYWIKVGKSRDSIFTSDFDFHVDTIVYQIKPISTRQDSIINVKEWLRRQ